MNRLSRDKQVAVISALVEGSSVRSVERMTGVHRDTILRLLVRVGERCETIMAERMTGLRCRSLQADEIWTYIGKKESQVAPHQRGMLGVGDAWVFVAIDPESKLVPAFAIGKRDGATAERFLQTVRDRLADDGRVQLPAPVQSER